jgi:hypothetical protein
MTRYCILCRGEISEKRARRGAITCSKDHQQEYRRQRRNERALWKCRLCGRRARRPKGEIKATDSVLVVAVDVVPMEHIDRGESSEPMKL